MGLNEFIASGRIKDAVFIYASEDAYCLAGMKDHMPVLLKAVPKGKDAASELESLAASIGGDIYISGHPDTDVLNKLNAKTFALSQANAIALSALKKSKVEMNFMPGRPSVCKERLLSLCNRRNDSAGSCDILFH